MNTIVLRDAKLDDIIEGFLGASDIEIALALRAAAQDIETLAASTLVTVLIMTKGGTNNFIRDCHRILFEMTKVELDRRQWRDAEKLLAGLR